MNNTTTTQTQLLAERLQLWDLIDTAVEKGDFEKAMQLSRIIRDDLTPNIRREYGL